MAFEIPGKDKVRAANMKNILKNLKFNMITP